MEQERSSRSLSERKQRAIRKALNVTATQVLVPLVRRMHPRALAVVGLYRSCMVVLPQTKKQKSDSCTVVLYHDPQWMGQSVTMKNLRQFRTFLEVVGQRSGPDLFQSKPGGKKVRLELADSL